VADNIINNPILFDASCSGIQHISALTLEKNLATKVNLITNSQTPEQDMPDLKIFINLL
jgi:DNA-directed RNA polymerase